MGLWGELLEKPGTPSGRAPCVHCLPGDLNSRNFQLMFGGLGQVVDLPLKGIAVDMVGGVG